MKFFKHSSHNLNLNLGVALFALVSLGGVTPLYAASANTISVDTETHAWKFQYQDTSDGRYKKASYIPSNLIEPFVQSAVNWNGSEFDYFYAIRNGEQAKQQIVAFQVNEAPVSILTRPEPMKSAVSGLFNTFEYPGLHKAWVEEQDIMTKRRIQFTYEWPSFIKPTVKYLTYGWSAVKQEESVGVKPGKSRRNMRLTVPNLPGVLMAHIESAGDLNQSLPKSLPEHDSAFRLKLRALLLTLNKEVPVLAPVITISTPYNASNLVNKIKANVQTWQNSELITPTALEKINRQFYVLLPAVERGDKVAIRNACRGLFEILFMYHPDLDHNKFSEDDEKYESPSKHNFKIAADGTVTDLDNAASDSINRLAARALGYNLMYLLKRSEAETE